MSSLLTRIVNACSCYLVGRGDNTQKTNENYIEFDKITYSNTVPFIPPVTIGKVIKVYDGDSITIASKLPNINDIIYRFQVRLNGIDTPEIKGKTVTEKELAKKARDALSILIMNKMVILKNVSTEKYGRLLADVYIGDLYVNEWLLNNNYAVKYDGGTKIIPDEWNK